MRLNSIIFHTHNLPEIRRFYETILNLEVGKFERNGEIQDDCSENYVNYQVGETLLCFEFESNRTDQGTIVVHVTSLFDFHDRMKSLGIVLSGKPEHFLKIKDPDGRTIIVEEGRST